MAKVWVSQISLIPNGIQISLLRIWLNLSWLLLFRSGFLELKQHQLTILALLKLRNQLLLAIQILCCQRWPMGLYGVEVIRLLRAGADPTRQNLSCFVNLKASYAGRMRRM